MANQYIVISYSADLPNYTRCRVVPEDAAFEATHSKAYGPDSKESCESWVAENCSAAEEAKG